MNGASPQPYAPSPDPTLGSPYALHLNLGFTGLQIWGAILAVPGTLAAAVTAGWLYVPAKSQDLAALEKTVQQVQVELKTQSDATKDLTGAVHQLTEKISQIPRIAVTSKKAKPNPPR